MEKVRGRETNVSDERDENSRRLLFHDKRRYEKNDRRRLLGDLYAGIAATSFKPLKVLTCSILHAPSTNPYAVNMLIRQPL